MPNPTRPEVGSGKIEGVCSSEAQLCTTTTALENIGGGTRFRGIII